MAKTNKVIIIAYSRQGIQTALKAAACFPGDEVQIFAPGRVVEESPMSVSEKESEKAETFAEEQTPKTRTVPSPAILRKNVMAIPDDQSRFYEEQFARADLMVFVGALGIAVRKIAPFVKDKSTDPAVVCLDEKGTFAISVLSGHIGGANAFAGMIAQAIDAVPVITTATDVNHRFSVDAWAAKHDMIIDDLKAAKAVSAAILEGDVPMKSDLPAALPYPAGVIPASKGQGSAPGILISWEIRHPFTPTLRLIPNVLHLGIGCRKGTSKEQIRDLVDRVLEEYRVDRRAIKGVYTIDLKAEEEGLLAYCSENQWPLTVYTAEELNSVPGHFTGSEFVQSITGVDNVCERAALKEAERLVVPKTAEHGVTAALAAELPELQFAET